jgi:hypothetical protein
MVSSSALTKKMLEFIAFDGRDVKKTTVAKK